MYETRQIGITILRNIEKTDKNKIHVLPFEVSKSSKPEITGMFLKQLNL